jgi:hypothetical protein
VKPSLAITGIFPSLIKLARRKSSLICLSTAKYRYPELHHCDTVRYELQYSTVKRADGRYDNVDFSKAGRYKRRLIKYDYARRDVLPFVKSSTAYYLILRRLV